MGSNKKQAQMERKGYFERRLQGRLSYLSENGMESPRLDKDTIVKNLRAHIEAMNARLKIVARYEEKTEELKKAKAAKAAVPRKDTEVSEEKKAKEVKEVQKEKKEKEAKEVKEVKEAPVKVKEKKKKEGQAAS